MASRAPRARTRRAAARGFQSWGSIMGAPRVKRVFAWRRGSRVLRRLRLPAFDRRVAPPRQTAKARISPAPGRNQAKNRRGQGMRHLGPFNGLLPRAPICRDRIRKTNPSEGCVTQARAGYVPHSLIGAPQGRLASRESRKSLDLVISDLPWSLCFPRWEVIKTILSPAVDELRTRLCAIDNVCCPENRDVRPSRDARCQ